jgi:hypothetical protein
MNPSYIANRRRIIKQLQKFGCLQATEPIKVTSKAGRLKEIRAQTLDLLAIHAN